MVIILGTSEEMEENQSLLSIPIPESIFPDKNLGVSKKLIARKLVHAADDFPLGLPVPAGLAQRADAAQVAHDVLGLAKVDLLEQVAHLELHVLDELANVGNLLFVVLGGQLRLDLARHVAAQVHVAEPGAAVGQRQDHGRRQVVLCDAGAVNGFEDVDGVP